MARSKKAKIYCENDIPDNLTFYLSVGDERYYLFRQSYKYSLEKYYSAGKIIFDAIDASKAKNNPAILRVMRKLPPHIRYVEKEYDISVLNRTAC